MTDTKENVNAKYIVTMLTIIAFAIAVVLWAVNSHSDLKEWAADQDYVTKTELKEIMKERYVPIGRFIKLETQLEEASKRNEEVLHSLDELKDKVDSIKKRR